MNFVRIKKIKIVNFYYFSSRCENRAVHVNTVWQRLNSEGIFVIFSLSHSLSFRPYAIWERIWCRERDTLSFSKIKYLWNLWLDVVDDDNKMRWDGNKSFSIIIFLLLYLSLSLARCLLHTQQRHHSHHLRSVNHAQILTQKILRIFHFLII